MTVKFVKNANAVPVHVYASGYGWVTKDDREKREGFVTIVASDQSITVEADDVPALVKALQQGLAESAKMIDAHIVQSRKKFSVEK